MVTEIPQYSAPACVSAKWQNNAHPLILNELRSFHTNPVPVALIQIIHVARHTLATLMAEIDIPKETIAKVLGHADNDVTSIYIKFNQKKIDDAVRKVIDYVHEQ